MRVVSWNIHWGCGKDGRIRIHAIIDVLRRLNPDVVCLQEVAANHPERLRGVPFPLAIGERRLPALHLRRFLSPGPCFRRGKEGLSLEEPSRSKGLSPLRIPPRPAIEGRPPY